MGRQLWNYPFYAGARIEVVTVDLGTLNAKSLKPETVARLYISVQMRPGSPFHLKTTLTMNPEP